MRKFDAMFSAAVFAVNECDKMNGCSGVQHTPCLQRKILDYFSEDNKCNVLNKMGQSRLVRFFTCDYHYCGYYLGLKVNHANYSVYD